MVAERDAADWVGECADVPFTCSRSDSLGQNTIALMLQRSYFPKLARTHTATCFEINTRRERGNFSVHFKLCLYLYEEPNSSQVA